MRNTSPFSVPQRLTQCIALFLALLTAYSARAQLPHVPDSQLAVDLVKLRSGQRIYGFLLATSKDGGVEIAVERAWLQTTYPDFFQEQIARERERLQQAREQLLSRITTWINRRSDAGDAALQKFLQSEQARIRDGVLEDQLQRKFIILPIAKADAREIVGRAPEMRQIAGLAYQYGLGEVVISRVSRLQRRLQELGVDPQAKVVDLSAELPSWLPQTEREWAAKQALIEYQLREELEYQGTKNNLLRKTREPVNLGTLVGNVLTSVNADAITQLGAELGLPEFQQLAKRPNSQKAEPAWLHRITQEAQAEDFTGLLVTLLEQNMLSSKVAVETNFLVQDDTAKWFVVFQSRAEEDGHAQTAQRVERLKQDPQVKQILEALSKLGLNITNRLDQALRHGVAVERALERAKGDFHRFLAESTRTVDGMPVSVSEIPAGAAP